MSRLLILRLEVYVDELVANQAVDVEMTYINKIGIKPTLFLKKLGLNNICQ